jgi:hypothetical protein
VYDEAAERLAVHDWKVGSRAAEVKGAYSFLKKRMLLRS